MANSHREAELEAFADDMRAAYEASEREIDHLEAEIRALTRERDRLQVLLDGMEDADRDAIDPRRDYVGATQDELVRMP